MRFRAKIFLAVLVPSFVLVAGAVAVALGGITLAGERAAREEFGRTQRQVANILKRKQADLEWLRLRFTKPLFMEIVIAGLDPKERTALQKQWHAEFDELTIPFEYVGLTGRDRKVWATRYDHNCNEKCAHRPDLDWVDRGTLQALFRLDERILLGRQYPIPEAEGGAVVLGREMEGDLSDLSVKVELFHAGKLVYQSLDLREAGGAGRPGLSGDVEVAGVRHLAGSSTLAEGIGDMVLYRSMADVDGHRRDAVFLGAAGLGLAVVVASLVSLRIARGVSRPVETLVAATRKVGEGDYTVAVAVPGRDELTDLGRAFNDMTAGLRKRREIMEKTLSRDVAEELMKGVELGGERRDVTVVFMDIRGFTSATEGVDPAAVVSMLNDMMEDLAGAISRHGGNVNKFLGDGLMAMFGAPRDLPDHAFRAVQAGLEMQRAMSAWNERRSGRGLPPLRIGIGVNSGVAVGGKVGSRERLEYTLIGEEVNLASRICGKAAPGQVLVTKQVFDRLGGRVAGRELEPVTVKGLSYPVQVYEVTE